MTGGPLLDIMSATIIENNKPNLDEAEELLVLPQCKGKETIRDVGFGECLTDSQLENAKNVVQELQIFADLPGSTDLV